MRNFSNKKWSAWGMLILGLLLNIAIITTINDGQPVPSLFIISIALFALALYHALSGIPSFWSIVRGVRLFTKHPQNELLSQSGSPGEITKDDLKVLIGNDQCNKPYSASLLSIQGRKNTSYPPFRLPLDRKRSEAAGRMAPGISDSPDTAASGPVLQVDATDKGCQTPDTHFDSVAFKRMARQPSVKMIEIQLNTPAQSGIWVDSTVGIKQHAEGKPGLFAHSENSTFRNAEGLVDFIERLRILSGGKPVGIRIAIHEKEEFSNLCHTIRKTQIFPDFMVITGSSPSAGISHSRALSRSEMPLYEALLFVSQTLHGYRLERHIKVIAAATINSAFDILSILALGAHGVYADTDGPSLLQLHTTQQMKRPYRNNDIANTLMLELMYLLRAGGFQSINDVTLPKFISRLDILQGKEYRQPDQPVVHSGTVRRVFYDKVNSRLNEKNKSQEKASLS